jgi:centromere protein J
MTKLRSERAEFETYKDIIQGEHENLMQSNREKLVKEKRILERQVRAQLQMPNRKDRSEIDSLRATIEKMKILSQKKEGKWKVTQRRMQDRNDVLKEKLQEVEESVRYLQEQLHERKWSGGGEHVVVRQSIGERRSKVPTSTTRKSREFNSSGNQKKESQRYSFSFDERFEVTAVETAHAITSSVQSAGQKLPGEMLVETPAISSAATQHEYNPSKYNTMTGGHTDYDEEASEEEVEERGVGVSSSDVEKMDFDDRYEYLQKEKEKLATALGAKEENIIVEEADERHCSGKYDNRLMEINIKRDDLRRNDSRENRTMEHCNVSLAVPSHQSVTTVLDHTKVGPGKIVDSEGVETVIYEDGKKERRYPNGMRMLWFRNGTIKEILQDGSSTVKFANGDIKKTHSDTGLVVYFYASANTTHTTYKNGVEIFEFPNGQVRLISFFSFSHSLIPCSFLLTLMYSLFLLCFLFFWWVCFFG